MREIVFRGKDFYDKWVYGYLIHGDEDKEAHSKYPGYYIVGDNFNDKFYHIDRVPKESIGQFTGLYDKNNDGIFEGDFVKDVTTNELFEIIYQGHQFIRKNSQGFYFYTFDPDEYEVIGNIYDNPELIHSKED